MGTTLLNGNSMLFLCVIYLVISSVNDITPVVSGVVRARALHCLSTTQQWYYAAATQLQCIGHPQRYIYRWPPLDLGVQFIAVGW